MNWINSKDKQHPDVENLHESVLCLVYVNEQVKLLTWNEYHKCWDDENGDDFYCNKVDYWMEIPKITNNATTQDIEFEALFIAYWKFVYKYHVGNIKDFDPQKPLWYADRETFAEELYESGMMIKVREGY